MKKETFKIFILFFIILNFTFYSYATNMNMESDETNIEIIENNDEDVIVLNFETKFENEVLINEIEAVEIKIPLGIINDENEEKREILYLKKEEGFKNSIEIPLYLDVLQIHAKVYNDIGYVYNIEFENLNKATFFGKEIDNSCQIENVKTLTSCDIVLFISNNEDIEIKDVNLAPTLDDFYNKVANGEFAESRKNEIEKTIEIKETQNENKENNDQNENHRILDNPIFSIIFIITSVIIIISGSALIIIRKRINEDDD